MKKIIISIALVVAMATGAMAQTAVSAGYLNSKQTVGNSETPFNGFYVGFDYTIPIASGLNLTPGLYYDMLMTSKNANVSVVSGEAKTTEHYVAVPVNVSYGINLSDAAKLFVYAGPTFKYGVAAQAKYSVSVGSLGGASTTTDLYGDNSTYARFNVLVGGGAGIELNNQIRFTVGYNYGCFDRNTTDSITLTESGIHAGVSFLF